MSSPGDKRADDVLIAFGEVEKAIDRAVAQIRDLRARLAGAEERARQSDELLREFVGGKQDPAALSRRLAELEEENADLKARIQQGRAGVDQVLAQIQFLENRQ